MDRIKTIMFYVLMFLACMSCQSCVHDKWTTQDKIMEGTWLALHTIDYGQTLDIADQPDKYHEINPLLGEHPSRDRVHTYMLGTALLHPIIVNYLPRQKKILGINVPVRTLFQSISITTSAGLVGRNYSIGLKLGF